MTRETDNKILQKLADWKQAEGAPPEVVELYGELLRIQSEMKPAILGQPLTEEVTSQRLGQGQPLQPFSDLPLDWPLLQDLLYQVITIISEMLSIPAEEADKLRDVIFDDNLLMRAVETWYNGKELASMNLNVNNEVLSTVIQAGLWPFLTVQSESLLPQVDQEKWRKRYCPICGGKADFAFLTGEAGERWLSCSRCDTEWLFQRLECPYCGTQEQSKLAYFTDDDGLYRLYTCEQCRSYIKAIDLRKATEEVLLPLEKVITIDLDNQAQEEGYKPGRASES